LERGKNMGFVLFIIALAWFLFMYKVYGKFLSEKVFKLDNAAITPAHELEDGVDYVPTNKWVVWGHHFTSIAGLGPIVGPAIAIMWGWVPAILWVTIGTIVAGGVHDFGSLVVSVRNKGKSIGELTTQVIGKRAKYLFMAIIFLELWMVIAVFAMIMGILFKMYPQSVFPVWAEIPIALLLSYFVFKKGKSLHTWSWLALALMYATIAIGVIWPMSFPAQHAVVIWIGIMMVYIYLASILPVETLLQPRDYINAHELIVAMSLIGLGAIFAWIRAPHHLQLVAPAVNLNPKGAPPFWPMLFVTIACGAISGFHSLVSSGTSSKQIDKEKDTLLVGYGGMVSEGILAAIVILAVAAGIGAGTHDGVAAWNQHYSSWVAAKGLGAKIGAFVTGSTNMMQYLFGRSSYMVGLMTTIMGVFIVSFAGTSLDTATRAQRYIVQEFGRDTKQKWLTNKHVATSIAVLSAFALAMVKPNGTGALILWPLFGTINQLLASLTLLVLTVYLAKKQSHVWVAAIPMIFMVIMTAWAMIWNINNFAHAHNGMLLTIAIIVLSLMVWLVIEGIAVLTKVGKMSSKEREEELKEEHLK
jgi:carbon starvation protein